MIIVEVKSQKRKKRREAEWRNASDGDVEQSKSLSECRLDLMVSVRQLLAMERLRSRREKSLNGLVTPAGLRAIGTILEEFMMDRVQTLHSAPAAPSLVIDDSRACTEKSEDETNETNLKKQPWEQMLATCRVFGTCRVHVCFSSRVWKFWLVCVKVFLLWI